MKALVYGGSGDLARAVVSAFQAIGWQADRLVRGGDGYAPIRQAYSEFTPTELHDAYVFPQAIFLKKPLAKTSSEEIEQLLRVGLVEVAKCLANVLSVSCPPDRRIDYVLIGSSSAYTGFKDTALYCAAKHALVGLVRALNEEYADTGRRFWLFSMGTMDTAMGRMLVDQDPATFLPVSEVANRIVETITSPTNLFEPEVIIRRRTVGYMKA